MTKAINKTVTLILGAVVALMVVVSSCQSKDEQQDRIDKLKDQVIEIHDDAMAKMGEIMKLKAELSKLNDKSVPDSLVSQNIQALTKANNGMMTWMRGFSARFPEGTLMGAEKPRDNKAGTVEKDNLAKALEEELKLVKIVAEDIDKAILNAEKTLEQSH